MPQRIAGDTSPESVHSLPHPPQHCRPHWGLVSRLVFRELHTPRQPLAAAVVETPHGARSVAGRFGSLRTSSTRASDGCDRLACQPPPEGSRQKSCRPHCMQNTASLHPGDISDSMGALTLSLADNASLCMFMSVTACHVHTLVCTFRVCCRVWLCWLMLSCFCLASVLFGCRSGCPWFYRLLRSSHPGRGQAIQLDCLTQVDLTVRAGGVLCVRVSSVCHGGLPIGPCLSGFFAPKKLCGITASPKSGREARVLLWPRCFFC
jgi:hypothetical protein